MKKLIVLTTSIWLLTACNRDKEYDASGNFEADEVIVAAQQNGELISYSVREGMQLAPEDSVGQIEVRMATLQKQQTEASIAALKAKTTDPDDQAELIKRQLKVQQAQLDQQLREQTRTENLVRADAATQKQLDDINASIDQLRRQINVTRQQLTVSTSDIENRNRSVLSEKAPLEKAAAQFQEQINKGKIINPVKGTVLVNYALKGEMQTIGKPLYKIANTDTLFLRAYVTGSQLPLVKTGQPVSVRIDQGKDQYKVYPGTITWISDKAEFTPKTIQTKDERANMVYALKVTVKNDGFLKIGMYGEVLFNR